MVRYRGDVRWHESSTDEATDAAPCIRMLQSHRETKFHCMELFFLIASLRTAPARCGSEEHI